MPESTPIPHGQLTDQLRDTLARIRGELALMNVPAHLVQAVTGAPPRISVGPLPQPIALRIAGHHQHGRRPRRGRQGRAPVARAARRAHGRMVRVRSVPGGDEWPTVPDALRAATWREVMEAFRDTALTP